MVSFYGEVFQYIAKRQKLFFKPKYIAVFKPKN